MSQLWPAAHAVVAMRHANLARRVSSSAAKTGGRQKCAALSFLCLGGTPDLRDPPGVFPDPPGLSRGSPISSSPVSFARRVARSRATPSLQSWASATLPHACTRATPYLHSCMGKRPLPMHDRIEGDPSFWMALPGPMHGGPETLDLRSYILLDRVRQTIRALMMRRP